MIDRTDLLIFGIYAAVLSWLGFCVYVGIHFLIKYW